MIGQVPSPLKLTDSSRKSYNQVTYEEFNTSIQQPSNVGWGLKLELFNNPS